MTTKLYYHRTSGGAEYLTDAFIECDDGHREGIFEGANYIVRFDGELELLVTSGNYLLTALEGLLDWGRDNLSPVHNSDAHPLLVAAHNAIAKAKGGGE